MKQKKVLWHGIGVFLSASVCASADNMEERSASTGCSPVQGPARPAQGLDAQRHERSFSDPAKRIFVSAQDYQDDPLYDVYHSTLALDLVGFEEFRNPAQMVMGFRHHQQEAIVKQKRVELEQIAFKQQEEVKALEQRTLQLERRIEKLTLENDVLRGRLQAVSIQPGPSSWPKDSFVQSYRWGPFVQGEGVTAIFDEMAGFMPASKEGGIEDQEIPGPALQTNVFFRDASGGKGSVLVADQRVAQFYDESPLTSPSISPVAPAPRMGSRSGPSIPTLDLKSFEKKKKKKKKKKGRRTGGAGARSSDAGSSPPARSPHK